MSYLTCTNCLQKAPDTATRCPHCGRAFGRAPERPGDSASRTSIPVAVLLAGTVLLLVAAYYLWPGFSVGPSAAPAPAPSAAPPETTVVATPTPPAPAPAPAPKETRAAPAESVRAVAPPPSRPPAESRPALTDTARPAADTARPVTPTVAAEPVSIDVAHQRYAQVFANLRAEPNNTATILRVLRPGEVVAVDSLQQGWYRVVIDQAVGYVAQQYLDTLPPSSQ